MGLYRLIYINSLLNSMNLKSFESKGYKRDDTKLIINIVYTNLIFIVTKMSDHTIHT